MKTSVLEEAEVAQGKALARNRSISDMKLPLGDGMQHTVYPPHTLDIFVTVAKVLGKSFMEERRQSPRKCRLKPGQVTRETARACFQNQVP